MTEPPPPSGVADGRLAERVAALDLKLMSHVASSTSDEDRRSLLALHAALADRRGSFSYLEIGSHLGGSLQAVVADQRCTRVVSIDPRPQWVPDERPGATSTEYVDNSTAHMRELLSAVPGADLSKLETIEASTEDITAESVGRPDWCFIDGEHTYAAALRDARFCRAVMGSAGVIAFHDFYFVERAILDFLRETARPRRGYLLRDSVFVVEFGPLPTLVSTSGVHAQLTRLGHAIERARPLDTRLLAAHLHRRSRRR